MFRRAPDYLTKDNVRYVSRYGLERRWKLSVSSIIAREREGLLTPFLFRFTKGVRSAVFYKLSEVEAAEYFGAHRNSPKRGNRPEAADLRKMLNKKHADASEAFRMFANGANRSDVVISLGLHPDFVDELYEKYKDDDLEKTYREKRWEKEIAEIKNAYEND